jgi:hypothetical protein
MIISYYLSAITAPQIDETYEKHGNNHVPKPELPRNTGTQFKDDGVKWALKTRLFVTPVYLKGDSFLRFLALNYIITQYDSTQNVS